MENSPLIQHQRFVEVFEEMFALLNFHDSELVIALVGVGGVGKSSILEELEKALLAKIGDKISAHIPLVSTSCVTQHDSEFNWPDWYERTLIQMNEPGIELKQAVSDYEREYLNSHPLPNARSNRNARLRLSLERALSNRQTRWLFMDEAHALARIIAARQMFGQLESLKSLTITTNTMIVTSGTPDLLQLFVPNSQLARRTVIRYMDPYRIDVDADRIEFSKTVMGLVYRSGMPLEPSLEWLTEYFYDTSQGAIGRVATHLELAELIARSRGHRKISKRDLDIYRPNPAQLKQLKHDIDVSRRWMEDGEFPGSLPWMQDKYGETEAYPPAPHPRPTRNRPGRRAPGNDPVGRQPK